MKSVIKSSSYMKEIATPDGVVDKVKARVVARENQQDKSIYTLDETSSPTVSTAAVLVTAAVDIASLPVLCYRCTRREACDDHGCRDSILECQDDRRQTCLHES